MKRSFVILMVVTGLFLSGIESSAAEPGATESLPFETPPVLTAIGRGSPEFRAITGVSMGGYGAMNIGLLYPDLFGTIACLGGPLDMDYLLKYIEVDMLGNYDNTPFYPDRKTSLEMLQDLAISFGNPAYYNPASPYYPPGIDSTNARVPTSLLNFLDGELNPYGTIPVITYEDPQPRYWVEVLLALDLNGNVKRDPGEPIIKQFHERFEDLNGNGFPDPVEPFYDDGLDGVPGTGDYGEGDQQFTYNPNRTNYIANDPLSHAAGLDQGVLGGLNLYIDAGTEDEFQFNIHAENFVQTVQDRGLLFRIENDFSVDFPQVNHFDEDRVYVRYPGGHVGFNKENIGLSFHQVTRGIREAITVANRFTTLFAFVSDHFPGGEYGTDPYELWRYPSKMGAGIFYSPSLNRRLRFGYYLPPGYKRDNTTYYPVMYLLGGYNMSAAGLANSYMKAALDALILSQEMQKMIIVIPDGMNYKNKRGHFFVNQVDTERGDNYMDSFFDLVTFIDSRLKTK